MPKVRFAATTDRVAIPSAPKCQVVREEWTAPALSWRRTVRDHERPVSLESLAALVVPDPVVPVFPGRGAPMVPLIVVGLPSQAPALVASTSMAPTMLMPLDRFPWRSVLPVV